MRTLKDCQLVVSIYPTFSYDARGGGGVAETSGQGCGGPIKDVHWSELRACAFVVAIADTESHVCDRTERLQLTFEPQTLSIPDVSYRTAKFLGVPLLPFFRIAIDSQSLTGWLEPESGKVSSAFEPSASSIAPSHPRMLRHAFVPLFSAY